MSQQSTLILTPDQLRQMQDEGAAAYPNECCGAMLGRDVRSDAGTRREVVELRPLANSFEAGEQYHRFSLDPLELAAVEKEAGSRKLLVLGFYHTHPDHPSRPSEYDRQHAWPFYSYAILRVTRATEFELTSWQLDEQTEQFRPEPVETPA